MTDRRATATPEKLDKILATLHNLQGRIDDPRLEDGPEKDLMREHAERLIRDYRITEEEMLTEDLAAGRVPIAVPGKRIFPMCRVDSPFTDVYMSLASYIAHHCEVRLNANWRRDDGVSWYDAIVVGYEGDTRYAEALFTEARNYFANRMEPAVDRSLPDSMNVYNLRTAGIERGRIGQMMGWGDKAHVKVTKLYKEECERRGEPAVMAGKGNSMKTYREAFSSAFPSTLWDRLWRARQAADASGGALVLASRKERVDEEFYRLYPHLRPKPATEVATTSKKVSRQSGWTKADQMRWERLNESTAGKLGNSAGAAAAREVNVKSNSTNRLED